MLTSLKTIIAILMLVAGVSLGVFASDAVRGRQARSGRRRPVLDEAHRGLAPQALPRDRTTSGRPSAPCEIRR